MSAWENPALAYGRTAHVKITRPGTLLEFTGRVKVDSDGELIALDLDPNDPLYLGLVPGRDNGYVVEVLPEPLPTAVGIYADKLGDVWRIWHDNGPLLRLGSPRSADEYAPFTLLVPKDNPA